MTAAFWTADVECKCLDASAHVITLKEFCFFPSAPDTFGFITATIALLVSACLGRGLLKLMEGRIIEGES